MKSIFEQIDDPSLAQNAARMLDGMDSSAPREYRELAVVLANFCERQNSQVVGLGGGQGAGKSTLATLLKQASEANGAFTHLLGIDDFYLTQRERAALANNRHELFSTRGPPGTHDVGWLTRSIDLLRSQHSAEVPTFDKGTDERAKTLLLQPPCDRVLLEGWCVGAQPQMLDALQRPLNELERTRDPEGRWRSEINDQLRNAYADAWSRMDLFVFLQVPNLQSVREWRLQQENDRPAEHRKDRQWVDQFVQHYQRITEWMLAEAPHRADVVVQLNAEHRVVDVTFR